MTELKSTLSYQVFFTANPTASEKNLFLTFYFKGKPLPIPEENIFLPTLSKATQVAENSFRVPNIVEVSANVEYDLREYFSSFICLMFTHRKAKKQKFAEKGLLIGRSVHTGYFLIGLWPYPFFVELEEEINKVTNLIKDITSSPKSFTNVLLLTEK